MEEPKISTKPIAENRSSYQKWIASEGIPIMQGFFVEDIRKVSLAPWGRTGGLTARICLEGTGETNDAHISEIPPGKALKPQKHMFEELIYIVSNDGLERSYVQAHFRMASQSIWRFIANRLEGR